MATITSINERPVPTNRPAWRPVVYIEARRAPRPINWKNVGNWAGWLALLAIPIGIMVWGSIEPANLRQVRQDLRQAELEEARAMAEAHAAIEASR